MKIENIKLKEAIKRISKPYKKAAGFVDSGYVMLKRQKINGNDYLVISNGNFETTTVERIKFTPADADRNIGEFHFADNDCISVYGEILFSLVEKNYDDFTLSLDKKNKRLVVSSGSGGKYQLSYTQGIEHSIPVNKEKYYEINLISGSLVEALEVVGNYQLPNTEINRNFAGILVSLEKDKESIFFRASNQFSIAEACLKNYTDLEFGDKSQTCFDTKFYSKSLLAYLKGYEKDVPLRFCVYENGIIVKDTSYTPEGNIDISEIFIISMNEIFTHYGKVMEQLINGNSTNKKIGSFSVNVAELCDILTKSLYSVVGNPNIHFSFTDKGIIDVLVSVDDYISYHKLHYTSEDNIADEKISFVASRIHSLVKDLSDKPIFTLYSNGIYATDKTEKVENKFLLLSLK